MRRPGAFTIVRRKRVRWSVSCIASAWTAERSGGLQRARVRIEFRWLPGRAVFSTFIRALNSPPEGTLRKANGDAIALYRPADRRALDELDIRPTEIVEFKGKDGTSFYGRLIKPPGFDPAKKYPLLVDVYGGPHVQAVRDAWPGIGMDQVFAQAGYVVWEMDNRGSAGRGHAFETPVYRNLGAQELADQREGVEYLIARGFIDPQRVGVTGWSYGGFMTLNLLFNAPDLFHVGFAGAPVTNWLNYDTIYTERYMGLPDDNGEAYARTVARAARAQSHGATDDRP